MRNKLINDLGIYNIDIDNHNKFNNNFNNDFNDEKKWNEEKEINKDYKKSNEEINNNCNYKIVQKLDKDLFYENDYI